MINNRVSHCSFEMKVSRKTTESNIFLQGTESNTKCCRTEANTQAHSAMTGQNTIKKQRLSAWSLCNPAEHY